MIMRSLIRNSSNGINSIIRTIRYCGIPVIRRFLIMTLTVAFLLKFIIASLVIPLNVIFNFYYLQYPAGICLLKIPQTETVPFLGQTNETEHYNKSPGDAHKISLMPSSPTELDYAIEEYYLYDGASGLKSINEPYFVKINEHRDKYDRIVFNSKSRTSRQNDQNDQEFAKETGSSSMEATKIKENSNLAPHKPAAPISAGLLNSTNLTLTAKRKQTKNFTKITLTSNQNLSSSVTPISIPSSAKLKTTSSSRSFKILSSTRQPSSVLDQIIAHKPKKPFNRTKKGELDIVTKFLKIVEDYEQDVEHCTSGTNVTLGEGVIDQYGVKRYYNQALIAVNRANLLTRLWKYTPKIMENEYLLYSLVRSMVEADENIFAAGNCHDANEYKDYYLFCPFAHYLPDGKTILVKDLSVQYKYMGNESEWFHSLKVLARNLTRFNKITGVYKMRFNGTADRTEQKENILAVGYQDGHWSKPYFDCGGGNIWMMTYTIPFFGFRNNQYHFKGTSGIDIDLRKVDIDQCPQKANDTTLNVFANSSKCHLDSTFCEPIEGQGFRRGSYKCICRKGFFFPFKRSSEKFYYGTDMEEEYEEYINDEPSRYEEMICLPCPPDCDECYEYKPCSVITNKILRTIILCMQCLIMCIVPALAWFIWRFKNVKVIVYFPEPSILTCTLKTWFRELGFSIAYGAILLKTWRIAKVFRVRSATKIRITDFDLIKRLGVIMAFFLLLVIIRSSVAPAHVSTVYNKEHLKVHLCVTNWWDYSLALIELALLLWGIKLSFDVRKAPSEFNESKFISMAIYNEFLLSLFLNISLFFLQTYADPDLLYIILFVHCQLTTTALLALIFGTKIYAIYKGYGNKSTASESAPRLGIKSNKFMKGKVEPKDLSVLSETSTSNMKEQDLMIELKKVYAQLEALKVDNMKLGNRHLPGFKKQGFSTRRKTFKELKKQGLKRISTRRRSSDLSTQILTTSKFIRNQFSKSTLSAIDRVHMNTKKQLSILNKENKRKSSIETSSLSSTSAFSSLTTTFTTASSILSRGKLSFRKSAEPRISSLISTAADTTRSSSFVYTNNLGVKSHSYKPTKSIKSAFKKSKSTLHPPDGNGRRISAVKEEDGPQVIEKPLKIKTTTIEQDLVNVPPVLIFPQISNQFLVSSAALVKQLNGFITRVSTETAFKARTLPDFKTEVELIPVIVANGTPYHITINTNSDIDV